MSTNDFNLLERAAILQAFNKEQQNIGLDTDGIKEELRSLRKEISSLREELSIVKQLHDPLFRQIYFTLYR